MSTLTKDERNGLEDVFLSIHTNKAKYHRLKELVTLSLLNEIKQQYKKIIKMTKYKPTLVKFSKFFTKTEKKKKYLSK